MILSEQQIKDIVLNNPMKDLVAFGKNYCQKLRSHLYGERMDSELGKVDGFESESLRSLRVKYAKSNKDLMARLARPIDKVFSAKGGSIYYNLSDSQDKKARQISQDVRGGQSIKQWIENFWKPHFLDDPMGFVFMEMMPADASESLKAKGKNWVYPTYKSIMNVFDYLPNGSALEYVVFNVGENEKKALGLEKDETVYRIVDDAKDYYVKCKDQTVTILADHTLQNYFGKVPAILNSDTPNPNMTGATLSFFDDVIELACQFLMKGSIKLTHEFMHGFPKYWEYADNCNECRGSGKLEGNDCPTCKGTGKSIMSKVSDAKVLNYPRDKDDIVVAPNVAGYVSPDKTFWDIATADLSFLEDLMNYTLWGANPMPKTQGLSTDQGGETKTATEIMTDVKPQSDRLHPITESAEKRHKFILDMCIQIMLVANYPGSTVNYGKRYMLESPDVLWQKYSEARNKGAAISVLDDLLIEYYEAKYDSDPVKLAIQMKLMKVEPFVHLTAQQLKGLNPDPADYTAKLYFSDWLSTLNEAMILSFSVDELKKQLSENVAKKKLPQEQSVPAGA